MKLSLLVLLTFCAGLQVQVAFAGGLEPGFFSKMEGKFNRQKSDWLGHQWRVSGVVTQIDETSLDFIEGPWDPSGKMPTGESGHLEYRLPGKLQIPLVKGQGFTLQYEQIANRAISYRVSIWAGKHLVLKAQSSGSENALLSRIAFGSPGGPELNEREGALVTLSQEAGSRKGSPAVELTVGFGERTEKKVSLKSGEMFSEGKLFFSQMGTPARYEFYVLSSRFVKRIPTTEGSPYWLEYLMVRVDE